MKSQTKLKQTEMGKIPEDWDTTNVESIASQEKYSLSMGPFGSNITKNNFVSYGVPVIRGNNLTALRFLDSNFVFVSEKKADELLSSNVKAKDIVITHRGTLGQVGIIPVNSKFKRYIVSQSGMKLTCDSAQVDPDFVFYWLKSPRGQQELLKNTSQTGVPAIAQPLSSLRKVTLPKPHILEQHAVAKIFSDLDSKIELDQQINKTLEEMGKAIFKHWFIDFEFPNEEGKPYKSSDGEMVYNEELGKEMPKGWAVIPLDQAAEFTRGFSYKGSEKSKADGEYAFVTLNSVKEFGGFKREFSYITSDRIKEKHFVYRGDIVIANTEQTKTGTLLGYPALVEFPFRYEKDKGIFSHHITKAVVKLKNLKHYLYYYLFINQQNAVKYNTGSVIWALDVNNWSKHEKIILPNQEVLIVFESLMENIFLKSIENNLQMETLSRIGDSLLPKLMSGKIRVPVEVK